MTEPVLATRVVRRAWTALAAPDAADPEVAAFQVVDLATGESGRVHLAGDVVVDAPGVRLVTLTRS